MLQDHIEERMLYQWVPTYRPGKIYEINARLIAMVKGNIFQGYATEFPYMHIKKIDLARGTFQLQDLTNEEIEAKSFFIH